MARRSRPPGFDMSYRPQESVFGPPLLARVPSMVYLILALAVSMLVWLGESSESGTFLFRYVVEEDPRRFMSIRTFAIILIVSSLSSVLRAGMRGVRIYPDGVEARDVLNFIVPKLKRYRWPQIERIVLDGSSSIALDLWDGSRAYLPHVNDPLALAAALEHVALARAIPVRGGTGAFDALDAADDSAELADAEDE